MLEPALLIRCRQADHALVEQVICLPWFFLRQDFSTWEDVLPEYFLIRSSLELLPNTRQPLAKNVRCKKNLPPDSLLLRNVSLSQVKIDTENWLGADKTGGLEILAQKGKIKVGEM